MSMKWIDFEPLSGRMFITFESTESIATELGIITLKVAPRESVRLVASEWEILNSLVFEIRRRPASLAEQPSGKGCPIGDGEALYFDHELATIRYLGRIWVEPATFDKCVAFIRRGVLPRLRVLVDCAPEDEHQHGISWDTDAFPELAVRGFSVKFGTEAVT